MLPPRPLRVLGLISLASLLPLAAGCGIVTRQAPEADVEALAKTWPPYRAPNQKDDSQKKAPAVKTPAAPQQWLSRSEPKVAGVPALQRVEQWDLQATAIDSLGRIGSAAVPALMETLDDADPSRRVQAALMLARIGPAADRSVSRLIELLNDEDINVRKAAVRALGQIGPAAGPAVDQLLEIIQQ